MKNEAKLKISKILLKILGVVLAILVILGYGMAVSPNMILFIILFISFSLVGVTGYFLERYIKKLEKSTKQQKKKSK